MSPLYINLMGFTIVRADSVRKYSVRFPEGTIVMDRGGLYTVGKIRNGLLCEADTRTVVGFPFEHTVRVDSKD